MTKRKRLRAMTCSEFCQKISFCGECPEYAKCCCTPYAKNNEPFRTKDGKYIFIEVKE